MYSEIEALKAKGLPDHIADAATRFLAHPDPAIPRAVTEFPYPWSMTDIGKFMMGSMPWNTNTRLLLRFFVYLADVNIAAQNKRPYEFLAGALRILCSKKSTLDPTATKEAVEEIRTNHPTLEAFVLQLLSSSTHDYDWSLRDKPDKQAPLQNEAMNLIYQTAARAGKITLGILSSQRQLLGVLSLFQPDIATDWCRNSATIDGYHAVPCWLQILKHSSAYDTLCLPYCSAMLDQNPQFAFPLLRHLHLHRGGYLDLVLDAAQRPKAAQNNDALELLLKYRNEDVIPIMVRAFADEKAWSYVSSIDSPPYNQLFDLMIERWEQGGEELLMNFIACLNEYGLKQKLADPLHRLGPAQYPALRKAIHLYMARLKPTEQTELWQTVSETHPAAFLEDFEALLIGKSKPQREIAAAALAKARGLSALPAAHDLLTAKKSDARLGATALIERIADPSSVTPLRSALDNETADAVRAAIHQALKACGGADEATAPAISSPEDFDLDAFLTRNTKGLKPISCPWLNLASLPPLHSITGTLLPEAAITLLIAKQSKHKELAAAPDILPLLAHIDRGTSAPFAAALVEGFLDSEQAAADRWALALGGLLGDNRIITLLLPRINDWCENSRHKLAEYAAQAISLLPGNEPLMVLDTLANRYRSKFKNVGKACADAFNAAATARGITADELGDMVVPDFGFDADGIRRFEWPDTAACAQLTPDFKLTWFDPETERTWKSLPASAPDHIKEEVKTLTKLLREAVKGQTARLELTLVRQRRWPVARWRELYETHPLLRSFASLLVWGVYDANGKLLRTFRRYPNGLLADAAGSLEELTESDTAIAMIHPLELDAPSLDAWRAHLARFKVKQPFPQIDRPVELMDPLHGNRKSISLTADASLSSGTFKSRAEKRGWVRGSVADAGFITSYYKLYPGAGVEVSLPTDGLYVGCDPMDSITLGTACFAKAGSIDHSGYAYDTPATDDPRVLRFDQVPPVVFSETISDLKAIIATKE